MNVVADTASCECTGGKNIGDANQESTVGYNVPFLSFVLSHIVGFINELTSQLSFQLLISGNLPHGKLLQLQ